MLGRGIAKNLELGSFSAIYSGVVLYQISFMKVEIAGSTLLFTIGKNPSGIYLFRKLTLLLT